MDVNINFRWVIDNFLLEILLTKEETYIFSDFSICCADINPITFIIKINNKEKEVTFQKASNLIYKIIKKNSQQYKWK